MWKKHRREVKRLLQYRGYRYTLTTLVSFSVRPKNRFSVPTRAGAKTPRAAAVNPGRRHLPGVEFVAVVFAERLRALLTAVEPVRKLRRHSRPEL